MDNKQMPVDCLKEFTKDEIIEWLKTQWRIKPTRKDLLFIRWEMQSRKLRTEYDAELTRWGKEHPDFAVRDQMAVQFNKSSDNAERLAILKKMKPYDDALADHIGRCRLLDARQKKVDEIYKQYEAEKFDS